MATDGVVTVLAGAVGTRSVASADIAQHAASIEVAGASSLGQHSCEGLAVEAVGPAHTATAGATSASITTRAGTFIDISNTLNCRTRASPRCHGKRATIADFLRNPGTDCGIPRRSEATASAPAPSRF